MTRSLLLAAAVAAGVPLAACGGKAHDSGSPGSDDKGYEAALKFSQCMRSHGLTGFPDPQQGNGGGISLSIKKGSGINPGSPQFAAAQRACRKYAPGGKGGKPLSAADQQKFLDYSQCMRTHGVPKFPDPSFAGGGAQLRIDPRNGVTPDSPAFQRAQRACQSKMPGRPGAGSTSEGPG